MAKTINSNRITVTHPQIIAYVPYSNKIVTASTLKQSISLPPNPVDNKVT